MANKKLIETVQNTLCNDMMSMDELRDRILELEAECGKLKQRNRILVNALKYYSNPKTYFAILFLPDPPCGDFINDIDDSFKPGKKARKALRRAG